MGCPTTRFVRFTQTILVQSVFNTDRTNAVPCNNPTTSVPVPLMFYSLNNLSGFPGEIRWSLDLRWQDYREDWGFFGLAKGITFRKGDEPQWRPQEKEWDEFLNRARRTKYKGALNDETLNDEIVVRTQHIILCNLSNSSLLGVMIRWIYLPLPRGQMILQ